MEFSYCVWCTNPDGSIPGYTCNHQHESDESLVCMHKVLSKSCTEKKCLGDHVETHAESRKSLIVFEIYFSFRFGRQVGDVNGLHEPRYFS